MKLKWNWGTGIVLAMILFITLIVTLVVLMFKVDFQLVEEDYYPKELKIKQHLEKVKNNENLPEQIKIRQAGDKIEFLFPAVFQNKDISGTIHFYYIRNSEYDTVIPITKDKNNSQNIPVNRLWKGRYKIKIDYSVDGKGYYQEESVTFN